MNIGVGSNIIQYHTIFGVRKLFLQKIRESGHFPLEMWSIHPRFGSIICDEIRIFFSEHFIVTALVLNCFCFGFERFMRPSSLLNWNNKTRFEAKVSKPSEVRKLFSFIS